MEKCYTEYKIVTGDKDVFEKEINRLSREGWLAQGSLSPVDSGYKSRFSVLMFKSSKIEEPINYSPPAQSL